MTTPAVTSIAAAYQKDTQTNYVFYARPGDGRITFLKGGNPAGNAPRPLMAPSQIKVNNKPVKVETDAPQVTAVAYTIGGSRELRVYYIGGDGFLHELCNSNDSAGWTEGALDSAGFEVNPKSPISSSVDGGKLKIFYVTGKANKPYMQCAWVVLGETSWSSTEINEAWGT